jgi:hypothetical protein
MKRRVGRSIAALFVGLAMSLMVTEPAAAVFIAGPESAFTGHLYYQSENLHYCGVGHSQVGDQGAQVMGWVFTRPALFYILCNLATSANVPTGWLSAQVTMFVNGYACGQSAPAHNPSDTALFGAGAIPCANPPGWQEWRTYGGHSIYSAGAGRYVFGSTWSPWALY